MRLGASLRWLGYPSGFSPTLADSLPFWTKIFWPASERTKSINSFAAFGLQLRLIRRSRASGGLASATALRNRREFQRSQLTELAITDFESWAKESFEIATKVAYRNGGRIGAPRSGNADCTMVAAAPVFPAGYVVSARRIADRRMILAGYRLADLLRRVPGN